MKKTLLTVIGFVCSLTAFAQNDTYRYQFNGGLNEVWSKGPVLTAQCSGTYGTETLAGVAKKTYRFDKGCGLVYNDAIKNFIASGTYTIELYFRLDTISGYKKLVDFDSLKQDAGLYNQSGKIVLYPGFTSVDSFVGAGVFQYVAITRDGTSKKMYINANGKTAGNHTDAADAYKLGSNKLLMFFRDDKITSGEQSKGAVAFIQISNYAIDSNTIKSNYTILGKTLNVAGAPLNTNQVVVYPNPAAGNLHVSVAVNCKYSICDVTGKAIGGGTLQQGDNDIPLDHLSSGLYLLHVIGNDGAWQGIYKFTKQ